MIIVGIDPATNKPIAYAIWRDGKLVVTGKTDDLIKIADTLQSADKVYIEDQYLGLNPKTMAGLVRCTGEAIGICKMVGTEWELVYPATWMSRIKFKYGKNTEKLSQHFWKKKKAEMLRQKATEITGVAFENEDEAAAAMIGYAMGVVNEKKM